jgi:hypothetical protein
MGFDLYWKECPHGPEEAALGDSPGYFRLNCWAMEATCTAMEQLEMLDPDASARFPRPEQFGLDGFPEWYDWETGPITYPDGTPEAAFGRAVQTVVESDSGGRIPGYKFWSNDGWRVTPEEIRRSLAVYDHQKAHAPGRPLLVDPQPLGNGLHQELDWWEAWIAFMRAAAEHGGIRVY